ncbi:MAG: Sua5 YciO YrdC YwlC family protein [Sulfurospirillum sp.]|nr:Sua5 YciO YrdC YwlC family protein [Sulfurospirillum sp.]
MIQNQRLVYLAQTDTTAGFLSQDPQALGLCKQRDDRKPFLICLESLQTLQVFTRVPKKFHKRIRRSKKSTFIYPNKQAYRVVKDEKHLQFLEKFRWFYSSSANHSGSFFELAYAKQKADIIIEDTRGFFEDTPSKIYKISRSSIRRIR